MGKQLDVSTRELTRARLKLREDLSFTPQQYGDKTYYHIELPGGSRFYRVGVAEYVFLSLLDGKTTIAQALTITARTLGPEAFTQHEATAICTWLLDAGLALCEDADRPAGLDVSQHAVTAKRPTQRWNPFWIKLPLLRPDRLVGRLSGLAGWVYCTTAFLCWLVLCAAAIVAVSADWPRFAASSVGVLAPSNWIWLGAAWVVLKVLHEFSHALACKKYGGTVKEMGLIFILFAPLAYVDVTSSWRFRSKWQRIHTAAAGMFMELAIAAIAAIAWKLNHSPILGHILYAVIFMASLTTLLFNANPLMRFDGYYILSDLLEIPNLYANGARYVTGLGKRLFLGAGSEVIREAGMRGVFVKCYGVAALLWRILVCASLAIAASTLFHGAGLVLAFLGIGMWLSQPALRLTRCVTEASYSRPTILLRVAITSLVAVGIVATTLLWMPWPGATVTPGVVQHTDLAIVRAEGPGFIRTIHVHDGQTVEAGTLLVELINDELQVEYTDLKLAIEQSKAKRRTRLQKQEIAAAQVELKNQEALEKRLAEKQRQLDGLSVRAPIAGRVMARQLSSLPMTYIAQGTELLSIGNDDRKELQVCIAQEDVDRLSLYLDRTVSCRIRSRGTVEGHLTRITPRATRTPPAPALCAPNGGSLPVMDRPESDQDDERLQLVEPHFTGIVELSPAYSRNVNAGELAFLSVRPLSSAIGHVVHQRVSLWLRKKLAAAKSRRR